MSVTVVVPWRGGCHHRARALEWVRSRYADTHPDWHVEIAEAPPGPWIKALAVMPAVAHARNDTVIVADADVWTDGLGLAVEAVHRGAGWAIPHRMVRRLTESATQQLLAGADPARLDTHERAYEGWQGGGYVVARRDTLLDIPLDSRFVGWGGEDQAWAVALHHLVGKCWRGKTPLYHLWHPPQQRVSRRRGSPESHRLFRRYVAARTEPDRLRQILEEARVALTAAQPAVHDHPADLVG